MRVALIMATLISSFVQHLKAEDISSSPQNVAMQDSSSLLWGVISGSKLWQNDADRINALGVYRFYSDKNISFKRVVGSADFAIDAGVYANGKYYTITSWEKETGNLYNVFDANTWKMINDNPDKGDLGYGAGSLAYDPLSGNYYGMYYNQWTDSPTEFSSFDPMTGLPTLIHSSYNGESLTFPAMAISRYGDIYAMDLHGELYKIDKESGTSSLIGFTGVTPRYSNCMTFDYRNDKLFWYAVNKSNNISLYVIDTKTAKATAVAADLDVQMGGLYVENPIYGTPDWVKNISYVASGKRGKGTLSFVMPDKTIDGLTIDGTMDLRIITDNGDTINVSNVAAGKPFSTDLTLPENGLTRFSITAKNEKGYGLTARLKTWTGVDVPKMNGEALLSNVDGNVALSWNKPSIGENNGFIDDDNITYKVTRNDGKVMADGIKDCNINALDCSDSKYSYVFFTIVATNAAGTSQEIKSNSLLIGQGKKMPYMESFANATTNGNWYESNQTNNAVCWHVGSKGISPEVDDKNGDNGLLSFSCYSSSVPKGTVSRIISPAIDTHDMTSVYLNFSLYHYSGMFTTNDAVTPEIVLNDGSIIALSEPIARSASANGWKDYSFNLGKYVGNNIVSISFKGQSDYGYNIHLDNIQVTSSPISAVNQVDDMSYSVVAGRGCIKVTSSLSAVKVVNVNGMLVSTVAPNTTVTLPLSAGCYIIKVDNNVERVMVR